jgi:hypothetical protein
MADITAVFGEVLPSQESKKSACEKVELVSSQEAKALVDWSLDPPAMIRIGGDGFTEMAKMETIPTSAFQIAVFANGDRVESCYTFELHF